MKGQLLLWRKIKVVGCTGISMTAVVSDKPQLQMKPNVHYSALAYKASTQGNFIEFQGAQARARRKARRTRER